MDEPTWIRSTRCGSAACVEVAWTKSSRSLNNGACVEVRKDAEVPAEILVRDSKLGNSSPVLCFTPTSWTAFTSGVKAGVFA
jgi:hypothetical protein